MAKFHIQSKRYQSRLQDGPKWKNDYPLIEEVRQEDNDSFFIRLTQTLLLFSFLYVLLVLWMCA